MKPHIQEAQSTPKGINSKQSTPKHILIQLSKAQNQENLENKRRKCTRGFRNSNRHTIITKSGQRLAVGRKKHVRSFVAARHDLVLNLGHGYSVFALKSFEMELRGVAQGKYPTISCFYP